MRSVMQTNLKGNVHIIFLELVLYDMFSEIIRECRNLGPKVSISN